jgi:hypothetical protein
MQNSLKLDLEYNANLRDIKSNVITRSKPDAEYIAELNKVSCAKDAILVEDDSNNSYEQKNIYCYNNGDNKKLVQWKKVDGLWLSRNLTNTSEYKEVNGNVCKIETRGCDAYNPSQGCVMKCFLNDKTSTTFSANYMAFP